MGTIRRYAGQGELFPPSHVVITQKVYEVVIATMGKKFNERIRKITRREIERVISEPVFSKKVYLETLNRNLTFPIVVLEIARRYPYSYCWFATIVLQLPLLGDCGLVKRAMAKIADRAELREVLCSPSGIELGLDLPEEPLLCRISPSPFPSSRGNGRDAFVLREEFLSGNYSPIIE